MKKFFSLLALTAVVISFSCSKEEDPFLITQNRVGKLSPDVQINELDDLYQEDSLVRDNSGDQGIGSASEIEIYSDQGNLLLVLQPNQQFDSTSTISNIQVVDPRYKTEKGLGIESTFGDIVENYSISRIENTLSSAVVFIDELNIYISIDKKHLPSELRFDTDTKIEASQIPDDARFKHFMIGWD